MIHRSTGDVAVVGAGLAGCEAALVLARLGFAVDLYEMRPDRMTPAHKTGLPAELVCSNSLKTDCLPSAHGLLKSELALLGSPMMRIAQENRVPAGSALAVDRDAFAAGVLDALMRESTIRLMRREITAPPADKPCLIAAGPLAADSLTNWLAATFGSHSLSFYDAIAPIIAADSIDISVAFFGARRRPDNTDYLNCPFSEEEYRRFYDELTEADRVQAHDFEKERFFEACLPVEVIAQRGYRALTFGALRPVGLDDPGTGRRPFAVCQLRREDRAGTAYNLVGFQTRLTVGAQKRVFRLIPALENAEFLRYGSIHRNTYLDSPVLLNGDLSFKALPHCFLAGQLCGNEGYTESVATGHLAALFIAARIRGRSLG
ncbi:MAG: methylenetetrahydrofolate--tRNA-(uracil(54)-C(5))-methyltransferase (FADH(2)-oxidizing) TrmFO, partial [Chitinivibrionales bacterium]|nr:methylenetetrahydrofolate--tRNA-(uracil(54)-C(5))-methyltransferase (FADH(2)-oxidizing) TrmFO [Chitinivibrionales bacterium]MBD3358297.1 methylenetetrahydrofolate--tRNA-(uracil(54)-C(5))-methyltransferase (FADH(2)-oxidizing) TrmFO [Chitinivibrionales bacterium]